jgi:outer membrane protein OmpA-like peptidoglycan-associated protein/Tol biopolymer transport system component/Tfp pilus assembly protein PilF
MRDMLKSILFTVLTCAMISCAAQPKPQYTTSSKKAASYMDKAVEALRSPSLETGRPDYDAVKGHLNAALGKDPKFIEALTMLGDISAESGDYEGAIDSYKKAIASNPSFSTTTLYYLAKLEMKTGRYADCKRHASQYANNRRANPDYLDKARDFVRNCNFAMDAMKKPVAFKPENLGPGVNTADAEYFPTITGDDQTLLYTRLLKNQSAYGGLQEDFFVSQKKSDKSWSSGVSISPRINTIHNEGAPTFGADGQTLVFAACALIDGYGKNRTGKGSCDLFITKKVGKNWTSPVNLPGGVNTAHWETQPSFSADGKTIYFVRGMKTRGGGRPTNPDIYVTKKLQDGTWGTPKKLSSRINTPGNENSVLIHPDGQTLYFSSDGHPGMGGLDLYKSTKGPNGEWGPAVNLGYPINTHNDENSLLVSADGNVAFFASDRDGGYGDLDLYSFLVPESIKPNPVTYMKGVVYDNDTKDRLEAKFELIDLSNGKVVIESYSNEVNGEFLLPLPSGKEYMLNVSRDQKDYLFFSDNFAMTSGSADDPYLVDVPLIPIKITSTDDPKGGIILKNVFFDVGKYDLKAKSKIELDRLFDFLIKNPTIKGELSGHTDSDGDDKENQILSQNRAKAVVDYLVTEKGIDAKRLTYKGYGESRPHVKNDTSENKAKNRRTEFKITGK